MTHALPAKFRTDLLVALRSGKYKQGRAYLRSANDEYCPLGVALDVLGVSWGEPEGPAYNPIFSERQFLLNSVGFWPVMEAMADLLVASGPFPAIADWIEANTVAA
jgi:hypothetical protein